MYGVGLGRSGGLAGDVWCWARQVWWSSLGSVFA